MTVEDLHAGADVISRDGHKLGKLHRFVADKSTLTLTHIVVDVGILRSGESLWEGGWGMSHDRVVPLGALDGATSREVRLTMSADEFRDMSVDYIDEYFEPMPDADPGALDRSDLARIASSIPGEPGPYVMHETIRKEADEVDIEKESPVWRLKPHEKIGEVERVLFDRESGKVTDLVIRRGHFFKKDIVLPVSYIVEVVADIVRVDMGDAALKSLQEFHPDD